VQRPNDAFALRYGRSMIFGHNTNVTVGDTVYHVQTEDRGSSHALIDTTVHCRGRVLHRRTNPYSDLLPLDADREQMLRRRVDEQHQTVLQELRSGALKLSAAPPDRKTAHSAAGESPGGRSSSSAATQPRALALELINARNWLAAKRATLQIAVRYADTGEAIAGALIAARIHGSADPGIFSAKTGGDGRAQLEFDIPKLNAAQPALVIAAAYGEMRAQLRFQLRAKRKVPSAG
jgi:hypothetical protein